MKNNNIFVVFTIFLGIVVVALLFTIATLQSESNQASQIDESMYANDSEYKALNDINK